MRTARVKATRIATVLLATLLATASSTAAQIGGSGSIQGTVLDTAGGVLPGATVTATNLATGVSTTRQTSAAGVFVLSPLPPGDYKLAATLDGFKTFVQEHVIVDALAVVGINPHLEVG